MTEFSTASCPERNDAWPKCSTSAPVASLRKCAGTSASSASKSTPPSLSWPFDVGEGDEEDEAYEDEEAEDADKDAEEGDDEGNEEPPDEDDDKT